jgi:hypothetical protein
VLSQISAEAVSKHQVRTKHPAKRLQLQVSSPWQAANALAEPHVSQSSVSCREAEHVQLAGEHEQGNRKQYAKEKRINQLREDVCKYIYARSSDLEPTDTRRKLAEPVDDG